MHTEFSWNGSWGRNELKFLASLASWFFVWQQKNPTNPLTNQRTSTTNRNEKKKKGSRKGKNLHTTFGMRPSERRHQFITTQQTGFPSHKWAASPVIKPCYLATNKYYNTFPWWNKIFHVVLPGLGLLFLLKAKKFKSFRSFV